MRVLILIICCLIGALGASAQASEDYRAQFPTENIRMGMQSNKGKNKPKRKKIAYIYTEDSKGILYGNPCAVEATRKMRFEYVVQPFGLPGSPNQKDYELNNFLVQLRLFFTRSPFWKLILKKRIRECAEKSGDIVG